MYVFIYTCMYLRIYTFMPVYILIFFMHAPVFCLKAEVPRGRAALPGHAAHRGSPCPGASCRSAEHPSGLGEWYHRCCCPISQVGKLRFSG